MFADCSGIIISINVNISNIPELSRLFVYLGVLVKFFRTWGAEKIAGLWFSRGISTQADTMS